MAELERLKRKAKSLYLKAQVPDDMDCGRKLAEYIRPHIGIARREFSEVWKQIKALDPQAPDDPFAEVQL